MRQKLHTEGQCRHPYEDSHRREGLSVRLVRQRLHTEGQSEDTRALSAHQREAVRVRSLWQEFLSEGKHANPYPHPQQGRPLSLHSLRKDILSERFVLLLIAMMITQSDTGLLSLSSRLGNLKTHMQRHAGTLPAKRYGQRRQVGHSRLLQVHSQNPSAYSLAANTDQSPREQSQLNRSSTDEDSVPPLDHSLAHRSGPQMIGHQPHSQTPDEALSPQNLQLKYAHQSSAGRDPLSALVSLQNSALHQQSQLQQQHRSPGSSPITPENMAFSSCSAATAARMIYSTPTSMPNPLAAHQTWLAAAGASSNLTGPTAHKSRSSTNPYEAFSGLHTPYGSFAAVQASPLSRLSLFSGVGVGPNDHLSHHQKQHQDSNNGTSVSHSAASHSQHHQFQPSNPNPDFSQLLE